MLLSFLSCILTCRSNEFNLKALWYLAVDSTHPIMHFPLLVRRSGTHYLMNSEIRRVILIALNCFLRQSCLVSSSVISALEVSFNGMRHINLRFTYLLTSVDDVSCSEKFQEFASRCEYFDWIRSKISRKHVKHRLIDSRVLRPVHYLSSSYTDIDLDFMLVTKTFNWNLKPTERDLSKLYHLYFNYVYVLLL